MRLRNHGAALAVVMATTLVAGSAGFSSVVPTSKVAAAKPAGAPKAYASALTLAQIATLSANPDERVIILLANQHSDTPGSSSTDAARAAALAADQKPLVGELQSLKAPNLHSYSFLNAVSATVSHDEAVRLAADPAVSAVVPDVEVNGPPGTPTTPPTAGAKSAAAVAKPAVEPASQPLCGTASQPLLEPEALQLMNVNFGPGSSQPAANDIANGAGVKLAVFPDGLDPNIDDFLRPGTTTSAIFDYQDFTGEGTGAKTGAGEAFGDASSIIGQGNDVFDLSNEVNAAHPLPTGCDIQIKGVAPAASLAVMKVFGDQNLAFDSVLLEGIEWAVVHDHVNILSESFGSNPVPDDATDPISVLDGDAVAAGITVVVSTGDAGTTNTIGTPSTNPAVISTAASTSYRLYAQTGFDGFGLPLTTTGADSTGFVSNNVSAFSSSGTTEYGPNTVDVIAPGEEGWSDCSPNTAVFTECSDIFKGPHPQPIEAFGGTSESAPLTAGTAALVIQAYRKTHGGTTPTPALVKQIIMSSSQDIDVPGDLQGAGLVDALRAVQTAESVKDANGSPAAVGQGNLYSPNSISFTGTPDRNTPVPVTVTNTSGSSETIDPTLRMVGPATTLATGTLQLKHATDPTFVIQSGATVGDEHQVTFDVGSNVDRLVSQIAWTGTSSTVRETLFDPSGAIAAQSRPQGTGGGFGQVEVHNPLPGEWTLLVFDTVPYTGPMTFTVTSAKFLTIPNGIVPSSRVIPAGGVGHFVVEATTPPAAGDLSESVAFQAVGSTGPPLATIPVTLRATVPVHPGVTGSFNGTLTGGNARMSFYGAELAYQFQVPPGMRAINANITVGAPGYLMLAFLADPNHSPVDVQSSIAPDGQTLLQTIHFSWLAPVAGLWNLDLTQFSDITSGLTSVPISGTIDFNADPVSATNLPTNAVTKLAKGAALTAQVKITNNGNSPEAYSIDPRLSTTSEIGLATFNVAPLNVPLPVTDPSTIPQFSVPPFSTRIDVAAQSTLPIAMTTSPSFGIPEVVAGSTGHSAIATLEAPDIPASQWSCGPNEIGPFGTGTATSTTYNCGADATTNTFDPTVTSASGNIWSALENLTGVYNPLVLNPGQSGTIPVTITPSGPSGTVVSGFLAVETFSFVSFSSDQLASLPYTYTIK